MTYGDRLKSLRTARNLSQQEAADRLSINRSTYHVCSVRTK
ncbi:helix-turn-helix domain-containing protein [Domibacillus tundrae]